MKNTNTKLSKFRGIQKLFHFTDKIFELNYMRLIKELENRNYIFTTTSTKYAMINYRKSELLVETCCGVKKIYIRKSKHKLGNGQQIVSIPVTKQYDFVIIDDGDNFWILPDLWIHNRQSNSNYITIGKKHNFYKNNFTLLNMTTDEMLEGMLHI